MVWKRLVCVFALALFPACVDDGPDPLELEDPAQQMGQLSLEWSISASGSLQSCPDVGAAELEIVATSANNVITETMSCFGGFGETGVIPAAEYQVEVRLIDADGGVLDTVGMGLVNIAADEVSPLGEIGFSM